MSFTQSYDFPVVMYGCENWTIKKVSTKELMISNVVLEKTLERSLDWKEIKPVNPKMNQPWIFIGRTDAKAEAPILWPPDVKGQLTGKDSDAGKYWGQRIRGWKRMGWLNGIIESVDMSLSKLQQMVKHREAWHVAVHLSQRVRHDLMTEQQPKGLQINAG